MLMKDPDWTALPATVPVTHALLDVLELTGD
jgi:hypothetical protein